MMSTIEPAGSRTEGTGPPYQGPAYMCRRLARAPDEHYYIPVRRLSNHSELLRTTAAPDGPHRDHGVVRQLLQLQLVLHATWSCPRARVGHHHSR